jgi:GTP cyclohydrolase I
MATPTIGGDPTQPPPYTPTIITRSTPPAPIAFGGVENREALTRVTPEELAAELLKRVYPNFNPHDQHSTATPRRFVESLRELCNDEPYQFYFTTFKTDVQNMIVLGPIPFYTLCAHHVVPFHGKVWIGYVPNDLMAGLSKFARAVKYCSKGMWVQEELTRHIHTFIEKHLEPRGLAVVVKAEHMCMSMRGVQTPGVITTTAEMSGVFGDHTRTAKAEFMQWIGEAR